MAIIMQEKMTAPDANIYDMAYQNDYRKALYSGYAIFWTGLSVGVSNLVCGYLNYTIFSKKDFWLL